MGLQFGSDFVRMRGRDHSGREAGIVDSWIVERMRGASRITYLWPGLSRLWYQGDLKALATAIAFAGLLNLVLVASFLRPGGAFSSWCWYGWVLVVAFWGLGVWQAARHHVSFRGIPQSDSQQDLFIQAQTQYLRGHWVEAQSLLEQLIRRNPGDVESRLLLSSVFRRSRRIDLSRQQLRRLQEYETAARWRFEIDREAALLNQPAAPGA